MPDTLATLVERLDRGKPVIVQAHDFPDHDAVATAFALALLLEERGFSARVCYGGTIQSESLRDAISALEIEITSIAESPIPQEAQLIVVDGFAGNSNMTGVPGTLVAVIDHHPPPWQPDCDFADIRVGYGACSTILFEYYRDAGVEICERAATALLMGIMMDTAFMTRSVSPVDLEAFSVLFKLADWQSGARLLKNSLSLNDLAVFREAINSCLVADDFCFVPIQKECTPEVMALVADFFLGLREVHFVVVLEPERDEYRLSVRSEDLFRPCDVIIRRALDGVGAGGGHVHMGGGSIPRDLFPGEEGLRKRFLVAMGKE